MTALAGTLYSREHKHGVDLIDVSCGSCAQCREGIDFWCAEPRGDAGVVLATVRQLPEGDTIDVILALSALAGRESVPSPVLVETSDPAVASRVAGLLLSTTTVVTADSRGQETREHLAKVSATGRAGVVVNVRDYGKAVRAAERGGVVVVTSSSPPQPALTEIVQRELTVIAVDSLAPLRAAGAQLLSAALEGTDQR